MISAAEPGTRSAAALTMALAAAAGALTVTTLYLHRPPPGWTRALLHPDPDDIRQMLVHYSFLPRMAASLLCGAALGMAGAIFQQVLRNPLASPSTLGVSAGAHLALAVATLWAPALFGWGRDLIALCGGVAALLVVLGLAWRRRLAPFAVVLAGLIVGLYCGMLTTLLVIVNEHYLAGLYVWGGGSLSQQGWQTVDALWPKLALATGLSVLMVRPLTLVGLDETARSLGLSIRTIRLAALAIAVALSAVVVSAVGVIGFLGLAAPAIARTLGARRFSQRLVWAPLIGASLLWLTDQALQLLTLTTGVTVPTGAMTALLGAPVLLWLLPRLRMLATPPQGRQGQNARRIGPLPLVLFALAVALVAILAVALAFGRAPGGGWIWSIGPDLESLLPWRVPRIAASCAAGAMLAMGGVILQRLTGNPMASPEVLGISSGAALGLIAVLFLMPTPGHVMQTAGAGLGALFVLVLILELARRSRFSPERVLLAGVALAALFGALLAVITATGDPRMMLLINWITGSTFDVTGEAATAAVLSALLLAGAAPLIARWLDILPLGAATAQAVGVDPRLSRSCLLALAALLTAAATLVVGPLSFVGLMAPHLARQSGMQRALPHLAGAAVLGAAIMVAADWVGRNAYFPWQLPAGLLATLVGGPMLVWLICRR